MSDSLGDGAGQPTDDQVEVAIASLLAALDEEELSDVTGRGPIAEGALTVERTEDIEAAEAAEAALSADLDDVEEEAATE